MRRTKCKHPEQVIAETETGVPIGSSGDIENFDVSEGEVLWANGLCN